MSTSQTSKPLPTELLRTVTPGYRSHPDAGMNAVGWGMVLLMLVLLVPLLPVVAAAWLLTRLVDLVSGRPGA